LSASSSASENRFFRRRPASTLAVCFVVSIGAHVLAAGVVLTSLGTSDDAPATRPMTTVDPGAHSISVTLIDPAPPTRDAATPQRSEAQLAQTSPSPAPSMTEHAPTPPPPLLLAAEPPPTPPDVALPPQRPHPDTIIALPERKSNEPPPATSQPPPIPWESATDLAHSVVFTGREVRTTKAQTTPTPEPQRQSAASAVQKPSAPRSDPGSTTAASATGEIAPTYPTLSRRRAEQGLVILDVEVLTSGRAGEIRILEHPGHRRLVDAAIDAVRAAAFTPAMRHGEPVTSWLETPVRFVLE